MKKNYEKILPTYICDIQEINNLSKVMFMSNFPHHQFILCTSGTGKICTENNIEQTVSKGDIIFINSSILFSLRQQENFSIKRIAFNGNFVTNYLQYFNFNQAVVFLPKSNEVFIKTIYKILLICTILSVYAVKVMFHQKPLF